MHDENESSMKMVGLLDGTLGLERGKAKFQYERHAAPVLPLFRGNSHTRGNIGSVVSRWWLC